jgi:CRP/FNR family cyclic AMP-dependent transcriptional regulator
LVGPTPERRRILRRSALFARLPDDEIDKMFEHVVIRRYAADAQIFYKGDPGSSMMAVLRGRVVIRAPSSDGKEVILNIINEERFSARSRYSTARSVQPTRRR